MHLLKQSTAATVIVGPVLDSAGAAVTTAVVGDFRLAKEGTAAVLSGATVTHDANGYYLVALTTTNTNTVGRLAIYSNNTAQSMGTTRFMVLLPSVYDALVTNAVNTSGGLPSATGNITALAGAISTFAGGAVASVTAGVTVSTNNDKTGYSLTAGTGLGNQTSNITGNLSGSVGSVTSGVTVTTNNDKTGYSLTQSFPTNFASLAITVGGAVTAGTVSDKTGYSLTAGTGLGNQTANITGNLSGSVGSISGVTFPTHFSDLEIAANGHVSAVVQSIANNSITASSIQGGAITAAKFAAGAIDAAALATDAAAEIAAAVRTELTTELGRVDAAISTRLATAGYTAPDNAGISTISDRVSYCLTALVGTCSDAQTAAETYTLSIGGSTFTLDYSGLDASGNRSTTTLTKV
jgi:hypothetical protein